MQYRYRSMDFFRAAAILLVFLAHCILSYGAPEYLAPLQLGGTGVDLFFALSGWLLGYQLFKEIDKSGRVDIKKFWIRRWMRTLPAYYAVLILSVIQRYATKEDVSFPWEYFIFTQNYSFPLEFFSISWSLCVEEQFYLIIAPLLALLTVLSKKHTIYALLFLLVLPVCFRYLGLYNSYEETHVRIDSCIMGVLLANIYHQHKNLWNKLIRYGVPLSAIALTLYILFFVLRYTSLSDAINPDPLLLAFIFGSWILLANTNKFWSNAFYFPGAQYIATRSYALYLLHPETLALFRRFALDLPFVLYFSLALIVSLALSEILYRVIEKPFMDLREKYKFSASAKL